MASWHDFKCIARLLAVCALIAVASARFVGGGGGGGVGIPPRAPAQGQGVIHSEGPPPGLSAGPLRTARVP
jgi:hypothetical protein